MAKKEIIKNEKGNEICGAKTKSRKRRDGSVRQGTICRRAPMLNGRCHLHGGKSTGPKNSLAYWQRQVTDDHSAPLAIENPMDLVGELGLVRSLVNRMQDDPLRAYCRDCKQWVTVNIECPNKEYDNDKRRKDQRRPLDHFVKVRDNNYGDAVKATKLLSDIAKAQKEIQRGKEVTIRVEILNFMINKVVEAYEAANIVEDPDARRILFIEGVERLLIEPENPLNGGFNKTAERR